MAKAAAPNPIPSLPTKPVSVHGVRKPLGDDGGSAMVRADRCWLATAKDSQRVHCPSSHKRFMSSKMGDARDRQGRRSLETFGGADGAPWMSNTVAGIWLREEPF
ncbi:hypothetical protein MY4824_005525 [Beauveria thailandica]